MNTNIKEYLENLRFGEAQSYQHICVIPLYAALDGAPPYVALADAMDSKALTVTEVSEGGSVPQLLVSNDCDQAVLIIDGEELIGAKQNRILNTSILLKERSRTVVPVSCTEQGRWAYSSAQFSMSDSVLERKIRSRKSRSVSESLADSAMPQSDQGEVWAGIQALHCKAKSSSPTSAMHDVFKAQAERLNQCLQALPRTEGQVGLLVCINGTVAGFDLVSRPEVYTRLHDKLVRSYVLDALLDEAPVAQQGSDAPKLGRDFVRSLDTCREEAFASVGYGRDHRYHAPGFTGSALTHADRLIHAAFLTLETEGQRAHDGQLSPLRRRRYFRQG